MAVYQGARPRPAFGFPAILRPGVAPRPRLAAPASTRTTHGRRDARARVGVRRPTSIRVGLILAAIIVLFSGSFLWLSQSVRVAATNYDIVRLISERDRLEALSVDLRSDLDRLSGEPAIRQEALDRGFGQLGIPIVVPAR
ncbi:MAG TPA: hypothetical protein VNH13_03700 [Candidatus Acidoferrales bacterium]|nr:hypothetical protein [Candidatus Acidoferrales bacterium]